jgi:hypothetical protein
MEPFPTTFLYTRIEGVYGKTLHQAPPSTNSATAAFGEKTGSSNSDLFTEFDKAEGDAFGVDL